MKISIRGSLGRRGRGGGGSEKKKTNWGTGAGRGHNGGKNPENSAGKGETPISPEIVADLGEDSTV